MAIDEVLLSDVTQPLLRVYRWENAAVSFGYFEKWELVRKNHPSTDLVRRWTGGGIVPHGSDLTYSLIVPARCAFTKSDANATYRAIHQQIAKLLRDSGQPATLASAADEKKSSACFENSVCYDILLNNRKVAGAAQRRTRHGLLHQGSVQNVERPKNFAAQLADSLGAKVSHRNFRTENAAQLLAKSKYASAGWLQKF